MRLIKICLSLLFIALFTSVIYAADSNEPANDNFKKGIRAFNSGDYKQALKYFKAEQEAERNTSALHYNLGVCYFKLKQYADAQTEFKKLTKNLDTASLAYYNLGLIALRTANKSKAVKHFKITYNTAKDKKLRMMAAAQLEKAEPLSKHIKWSGLFSFAAGYDDNVALALDEETYTNEKEDEFLELLATTTGQLSGSKKNGVQLKAIGYALEYRDAEEFNFESLRIGPELDSQIGEWRTAFGGNINLLFLDRKLFERTFDVDVRGLRRIKRHIDFLMRYQLNIIDAKSDYAYLSGFRHRFNTEFRFDALKTGIVLGYKIELNDRNDTTYPTRQEIYFLTNRNIFDVWQADMTGRYRNSKYLSSSSRNDRRLQFGLRFSRNIPWQMIAHLKYDFTQNYSNFDQNEYTSNVFTLGVERFF